MAASVYSSVFNWAHRLRGHLFQGRFRSVLIEDQKVAVEVARYLHLNPVRVRGLGLGKSEQRRRNRSSIASQTIERSLRLIWVEFDFDDPPGGGSDAVLPNPGAGLKRGGSLQVILAVRFARPG